jgi:integrase
VASWLTWCATKKRWAAPFVPADAERRRENVDRTKAVSKTKIERLLSRRDIPLRERTLWRMLYETAARAGEILSLDVQDLDLENRRAPLKSKGGDTEWVYWDAGTARLMPRLLRLPDGHPDGRVRTRGPPSAKPIRATSQRRSPAGRRLVTRGPRTEPANMPAPIGATAAQSTGPAAAKMTAEVTAAAPRSMYFNALAVGRFGSALISRRARIITPDPAPK